MGAQATLTSRAAGSGILESLKRQIRRAGPFGFIVLLHVVFFYALQSGLLHKAVDAIPNEVFATLITPQAPKADMPAPAAHAKTVPVVKQATPTPSPVATPAPAPSERALQAAPASSSPASAAPVSAAPAPPKTVSGVEYQQAPQPEYPATSKRLREEGKVMVRVLISEKGRPERAEIHKSSGSARLDEAARQAVMRALFKPYMEDGKPLAVFAVVPINFQSDS